MARAHGTAGRHATRNDAHPLARVVQVFLQRFAQRPIGWKAGAGAAELVPHLIQRLGIIAGLLDALEFGEVLLAVRTRKGPAHIASLAYALARYAVRTVVSIVTKRCAYGFHGVPDDMGDICVGVAVLPERPAELPIRASAEEGDPPPRRDASSDPSCEYPDTGPRGWDGDSRSEKRKKILRLLVLRKGGWVGGGSDVAAAIVNNSTLL
jgi:hypothetical protein